MADVELYAYAFQAWTRRDPGAKRKLDHLHGDGAGGDLLLDVVDQVLVASFQNPPAPPPGTADLRKTFYKYGSHQPSATEDRARFGRITVNRKATRYDLQHSSSPRPIRVRDTDRVERPLFYWIYVPAGGQIGLLLVERAPRWGTVAAVWDGPVHDAARNLVGDDVTVKFGPFIPNPVWEEYLARGEGLEYVEMYRVLEETDETKELDDATRVSQVGRLRTTIERPGWRPDREAVAEALEHKDKDGAVALFHAGDLGAPGIDEHWDEVKLRLKLGAKERTVRIGNENVAQLGYPDDDGAVRLDPDGYPEVATMVTFARSVAADLGFNPA